MMRDHVPTGTICSVIIESEPDVKPNLDAPYAFTNPHLVALAEDYAGRLFEASELSESD